MGSSATIFLSIASMLYMIMVAIVYFTKEKVNTSENKIFSKLVLISLASLFSEIYITFIPIDMKIPLFVISLKVYLILCVFWLSYFMEYVFIITRNNENKLLINYKKAYKKTYIKFWIITAFVVIAIILLPISFYNENGMKYSYGPSVNVVFGLSALYMIIMFIYIIKNLKNLKNKGYMPIIFFVVLLSIVAIVQKLYPNLLLANTCFALITTLMYYTIENPDIKIAKELAFSKMIAEESRDRTLNTLNEISDELKNSFSKLQTFGYKKVNYQDLDEVSKELKYIKKYNIDFVDRATGLLEIGKIESGSLTLSEKEYDSSELLEELRKMLFYDKKNKQINVLTEFENKVPSVLYGDKTKVEKLVLSVYDYILDIIDKDDLTIKMDSITVGRFSKIKFHFITQDSNLDKYIYEKKQSYDLKVNYLNELEFYDTKENVKYDKILKLASLLNAKLNVSKDDYGRKDLTLSIRQRIIDPYVMVEQKEENKGLKVRYFDASDKRILIVHKNNTRLKELLLLLRPYKSDIDVVSSINDMKIKLSDNKTYDMVIIDDTIYNNEKGFETIKSIKSFSGYDIKLVILAADDRVNNCEVYIKEGFDEYIIKPINKKNINYIMKKYLK